MKISHLIFLSLISLIMFSCDDDDPTDPMPEEIITTVNFTLTPESGGTNVVLTYVDLDGDGGNAPTISGGTLAANTTYLGSMELLNESLTPTEDITEEIEEEDLDHQFFFVNAGTDLTVAYDDEDSNGQPLGLKTKLTTGGASTGTLTVILRHEPNKDGENVADGQVGNAGGETDIEVSFDITIQ